MRRRHPAGRAALAARGRRARAGAGDPRVHPLSQARPHPDARRAHAPLFAGHGYACVRVDLRGSGDSDGRAEDEYLQQELDDGVEVMRWIAAQPWCDGRSRHDRDLLGRLQRPADRRPAARRRSRRWSPSAPPTTATPTTCTTWAGACWATTSRGRRSCSPSTPCRPTPSWWATAGARCGSSGSRAAACGSTRGCATSTATTTGSTARSARTTRPCEVPVMAVSGWADGYSNAVFRLMANLHGPREGAGRSVEPQVPAPGRARPGHRLPAGDAALVGSLAQGRRDRDHGRADAAGLDAGQRPADHQLRPTARAAGWPSPRGPRPRARRRLAPRRSLAPRARGCRRSRPRT